MALAIIAGILIFIFAIINPILKRFDKQINDFYSIPIGLCLILVYLIFEIDLPFLPVFIGFVFGFTVGAVVIQIHKEDEKKTGYM